MSVCEGGTHDYQSDEQSSEPGLLACLFAFLGKLYTTFTHVRIFTRLSKGGHIIWPTRITTVTRCRKGFEQCSDVKHIAVVVSLDIQILTHRKGVGTPSMPRTIIIHQGWFETCFILVFCSNLSQGLYCEKLSISPNT